MVLALAKTAFLVHIMLQPQPMEVADIQPSVTVIADGLTQSGAQGDVTVFSFDPAQIQQAAKLLTDIKKRPDFVGF